MSSEPTKKIDQAEAQIIIDKLWAVITTGSLVLAQEADPADGWWEAIVVDVKGGQATLEWRDFAEQGKFTRSVAQLAIMQPKRKP